MTSESADERIHRLARLGVVERSRLLTAGVTDNEIRRRLERGSLRRVHAGVYATFGRSLDHRAEVLAACWAAGPGTAASHRSALGLWDLWPNDSGLIEITSPRANHGLPDSVVVHRPNVLRPIDVVERQLVPVTNPLRTLLDAGAALDRKEVAQSVEAALLANLVSVRGLRAIVAELGGRGRAGTAALRWALDQRALGDVRPESMIEPLMARLLLEAPPEIGPVEYQPTLRLEGQELRPDFLLPRPMVIAEVDGLDAHRERSSLDRDLARQNLLVRHGYLVLRYTVTHLRAPARVAREIFGVAADRIQHLERHTA